MMMSLFLDNYEWILYIISGTAVTLKYSITSVVFGSALGIILALCRVSNVATLRLLSRCYMSIFRGTPVILQLSICYFVLPQMLNIDLGKYLPIILALSLNSAAYVGEIIRSGINSVSKGQLEAARALSLPYTTTMRYIILPQALRNSIPALLNEVINLIKESSIMSIIGELDIMRRAQIIAMEEYNYFKPLVVAGLNYYIIVILCSSIVYIIEKHHSRHI